MAYSTHRAMIVSNMSFRGRGYNSVQLYYKVG